MERRALARLARGTRRTSARTRATPSFAVPRPAGSPLPSGATDGEAGLDFRLGRRAPESECRRPAPARGTRGGDRDRRDQQQLTAIAFVTLPSRATRHGWMPLK